LSLLAKLDGHPPGSACTIGMPNHDKDGFHWFIKAVEDAEHYADRRPGPMHAETETALTVGGGGDAPA
jgi:hypothetical protein